LLSKDLSELAISELKQLLQAKHIDFSDCLEKADLQQKVREVYHISDNGSTQSHIAQTPCVIYLHGNCGCRVDGLDCLDLITSYGFSFFAVDLAGSGLSEGLQIFSL
jgi:cephalosporin-C deacetylase-like acetyl esterase